MHPSIGTSAIKAWAAGVRVGAGHDSDAGFEIGRTYNAEDGMMVGKISDAFGV